MMMRRGCFNMSTTAHLPHDDAYEMHALCSSIHRHLDPRAVIGICWM